MNIKLMPESPIRYKRHQSGGCLESFNVDSDVWHHVRPLAYESIKIIHMEKRIGMMLFFENENSLKV